MRERKAVVEEVVEEVVEVVEGAEVRLEVGAARSSGRGVLFRLR